MKYEIVELEPKTVVGISAVTANNDPEMQKKIGDLWTRLYPGGEIAKIKNRANSFAIGLYSDYEGDNYCVTAGCEVTAADNDDMIIKTIPGGKYAKFSICGHMVEAVAEAWEEIWKMNLERSYKADFEEYLNEDFENAEINLYISL